MKLTQLLQQFRMPVAVCALVFSACLAYPAVATAQLGADAAHVASLSGRVSVERGGELWAVSAGQTILAGQVIVTGPDGAAQLVLSDGSTLDIFPNSRVIFRANRFNLRELLDVMLGKVRLQIQHLIPGEAPLRVTSPTAVISVRGTVFEVEVDAAMETVVSVDTGAVSVRHRMIPGQEILVESGQSVRVNPTLPLIAAGKPVPIRSIGRVVRAVGSVLADVRSATRSAGGGSAAGTGTGPSGSGGTISGSDTGSNEPAPPPGQDDDSSGNSSGASGGGAGTAPSSGGTNAPPGDVLP
jgi:hypothetical protein